MVGWREVGLCAVLATSALEGQSPVTVTIVATTDVHGRVMHWDYVNDREAPWGLSRVAAAVDSIRRAADGPVVVLDAGDLIQGNPFAAYFAGSPRRPYPVMDAMNAIGYDAMTPGNHEFNFGVGFLDSVVAQADFPVVSANIYDAAGRLVYPEHTVVERGGVRIGVTGFTTPGAMVWDRTRLRGLREVRRIVPEAERAMANLERAATDLKIVVIHSGMDGTSSYDTTGVGPENVAAALARLPTQPHVVIVGHSHGTIVDSVIDGVHFVQPRPWARGLAVVRVTLLPSDDGLAVRAIHAEQVELATVRPLRSFERRMESPHTIVRNWLNAPIARNRGVWSGQLARAGDTPLIDFVNEVQRRAAGADLSATAAFNPDAVIPDGDVRRRDIMGVYPYENTLVAVRITGAQLRAYLEQSAEYFNSVDAAVPINPAVLGYNYDIVSGVEYVIDLRRPPGSRITSLVRRGRPVADDDVFSMALNDYRQGGGGNYRTLASLPVVYDRGENIRDLLVAEVQRARQLDSASYFVPSWRIDPPGAARAVARTFGATDDRPTERIVVRVLTTTDFFGSLEPVITPWSEERPVGGSVALGAVMDSLAEVCACGTLRVAAGDQLRGSVLSDGSFGRSVVTALNAAGIDLAVPGPGDVGWGMDTLAARVAESSFPWIAANLLWREGSRRPVWLEPWTVVETGGSRVAVIGIADDSLPADAVAAGLVDDVTFLHPTVAVTAALSEIDTVGADVVVVVAHLPAYCEASGCQGELIDFMRSLPRGRVDLVVGGHSDTEASAVIDDIPLVLPGSYGLTVGSTDLVRTAGGRRAITEIATAWADPTADDVGATPRSRDGLDDPVAVMRFPARHRPGTQSPFGNLVADSYRNGARAQIGIVWGGDVGPGFGADTLTRRRIHRVQPARRGLVRMTMRGDVLFALLNKALEGDDPSIHVSGVLVRYDPDRRPGDRVRRVEFTDGERLRGNRDYTVGMNAEMADGAFGFSMLPALPAEPVGLSDFEALVRYLGRLPRAVEAPDDQRFIPN